VAGRQRVSRDLAMRLTLFVAFLVCIAASDLGPGLADHVGQMQLWTTDFVGLNATRKSRTSASFTFQSNPAASSPLLLDHLSCGHGRWTFRDAEEGTGQDELALHTGKAAWHALPAGSRWGVFG
jgi:hypothetical protein